MTTDTLTPDTKGLDRLELDLATLEATIDARLRRMSRHERLRDLLRGMVVAGVPAAAVLSAITLS